MVGVHGCIRGCLEDIGFKIPRCGIQGLAHLGATALETIPSDQRSANEQLPPMPPPRLQTVLGLASTWERPHTARLSPTIIQHTHY